MVIVLVFPTSIFNYRGPGARLGHAARTHTHSHITCKSDKVNRNGQPWPTSRIEFVLRMLRRGEKNHSQTLINYADYYRAGMRVIESDRRDNRGKTVRGWLIYLSISRGKNWNSFVLVSIELEFAGKIRGYLERVCVACKSPRPTKHEIDLDLWLLGARTHSLEDQIEFHVPFWRRE